MMPDNRTHINSVIRIFDEYGDMTTIARDEGITLQDLVRRMYALKAADVSHRDNRMTIEVVFLYNEKASNFPEQMS